MSDEVNELPDVEPDGTSASDAAIPRYQHKDATRVVPMQRDAYGRMFWESYQTPASFQVWAEARIPPHLPGIIIFVHGVNSEGEWYDAAEQALCDGLNERLNREDLKPNKYQSLKDGKPILREVIERGYSPVIRFYWGYRPQKGEAQRWRIPLRNDSGENFWDTPNTEPLAQSRPWYWGGGPFQNGTNNLQQLWSELGVKRHVAGFFNIQNINSEWDRELHDGPPRTYFAHAAQRLADLIDKIRTECPRDTVSILSHSQGTMLALAATALCQQRAPDAVFLMNSPYALQDKTTDYLTCGHQRPTSGARVRTFKAIAERIKQDKRIFTEARMRQLQVGATEDMNFWRPDLKLHYGLPERDNHGRLYVYFCPHDRVMGATPLQSIGWQGLDEALLGELGDTVKQRMLARGTPCGDAPGVKPFGVLPPIPDPEEGVKPSEFWNSNKVVFGTELWTVPHANQTVTINAEQVPNPITAEEMSRSANKVVKTAKGAETIPVYFDEAPRTQHMWGAKADDGISFEDASFPYLASLYRRQKFVRRDDAYGVRSELETTAELRKRITEYQPMPPNHSTLPGHAEFMRRVVAYDLPIGFCDSYEEPGGFWTRLIQDADWTSLRDPYYRTGQLSVPPKPPQLDPETVSDLVNQADEEKLKWRGA